MTRATKPTTQATVTARWKAGTGVSAAAREEARPSGIWLCGEAVEHAFVRARDVWSESELVERMVGNDELAWREFLQRYHALIRSVIERTTRRFSGLVGSWENDEIYASFLHSLLQRDMHKLRMFDARRGTHLSTWIGLLATNAAWDHVRAALRRPQGMPALAAEISAPGPDPLAELVARETVRELRELLDALSAKDKRFIELFYVHALSVEQIAVAMNISVKTVYSKKHKLSARLQSAPRARGRSAPSGA